MRTVAWLFVLAACGEKPSDSDTDTDTDTDADTDTDTDTDSGPALLTCATSGCEGDVLGNWTIQGECFDDPQFAEVEGRCPGIEVDLYAGSADGTMNFNASGQYSFSVPGGTTGIGIVVPPECNEGCLTYELTDYDVRCETTGLGGCTCSGSVNTSIWVDGGTFVQNGSTLALHSDATGSDRTIDVCAEGTVVWFRDLVRERAVGGVATPP